MCENTHLRPCNAPFLSEDEEDFGTFWKSTEYGNQNKVSSLIENTYRSCKYIILLTQDLSTLIRFSENTCIMYVEHHNHKNE